MSLSKIPTGGMLYEGALLGAGVLGVFLWRKDVLPKYIGIISIGAASFGLCTVIWHILIKKDKKSDIDFGPIDAFYKEIASQINQELSDQDGRRGELEVERHALPENDEFDPIAYLRSGTELSEIYKKRKEASDSGNFLKECADSFRLKEASTSKVDNSSVDNLELPFSEYKLGMNLVKKRREIPKHYKINIRQLDKSSGVSCCEGQLSQNIPGQRIGTFNQFATGYPRKEISDISWKNPRKLLGAFKDENDEK